MQKSSFYPPRRSPGVFDGALHLLASERGNFCKIQSATDGARGGLPRPAGVQRAPECVLSLY